MADAATIDAPRTWLERLWSSIADRGRAYATVPAATKPPLERAQLLANALISARGEASGAAVARELLDTITGMDPAGRADFRDFLATGFLPNHEALKSAAEAYLADPTAERAMTLFETAEPPRQELLRRMNMARGGTAALVELRREMLGQMKGNPQLRPLDVDLRHLFASWFNRGFLELRRIDWETPASVLEKLIRYEAVHEIAGWDDLRRRLAPDRRCFGFFHRALPNEPLIFVEVALVKGLASAIQPLLAPGETLNPAPEPGFDTAIFYSINNCQDGLRGVSFGNFLIKQVVEELKTELPGLTTFSTLSPVPGFCRWLHRRVGRDDPAFRPAELEAMTALAPPALPAPDADPAAAPKPQTPLSLLNSLTAGAWWEDAAIAEALRAPLLRLAAEYLTRPNAGMGNIDPVARFHLGNGAGLERINWLGNTSARGMQESLGIMVNYLYDPETIEANHESFIRSGKVVRAPRVDTLLAPDKPVPPPSRMRLPRLLGADEN